MFDNIPWVVLIRADLVIRAGYLPEKVNPIRRTRRMICDTVEFIEHPGTGGILVQHASVGIILEEEALIEDRECDVTPSRFAASDVAEDVPQRVFLIVQIRLLDSEFGQEQKEIRRVPSTDKMGRRCRR